METKQSGQFTWHSPNKLRRNQIGYIMVPTLFQSGVNIPRTYTNPRAAIGSDSDLVLITFNVKLQKICKKNLRASKSIQQKFNLGKLKYPSVAGQFEVVIGKKLTVFLLLDLHAENMTWLEILGKKCVKNKPWVTDEVLEMCGNQREAKKD